MQIGQAGRRVGSGRLEANILLGREIMFGGYISVVESVVVLSVDIPSVPCSPAIRGGSNDVEDGLGCCLTLSFSSPLSPICLGNHAPRCREKGRVGVVQREIQLTEGQKWGENTELGNAQNIRKAMFFQYLGECVAVCI